MKNRESNARFVRRTLFDGDLMRVGFPIAYPESEDCAELAIASSNELVLPTAGVFKKHDGPRQHVLATPNHALFVSTEVPYRLSFPGRAPSNGLIQCLPKCSVEPETRTISA